VQDIFFNRANAGPQNDTEVIRSHQKNRGYLLPPEKHKGYLSGSQPFRLRKPNPDPQFC